MRIVDHIVVAVDFSEPSRVAVRAALRLASAAGAKRLTVLHALRPTVLPHGRLPEVTKRLVAMRDRIHQAAHEQMKQMITEGCAFELDFKVVEGLPARVIPTAARDLGGTMLAVGTHARRGIHRWLTSSVVEAMLHRLHLPTLVMPTGDDGIPPEVELQAIKHVTVAIDTHDAAELVARRALEALQAVPNKPEVKLVTVVDFETPQFSPDDTLADVHDLISGDARTRLDQLKVPYDEAGFTTAVEVRSGDVEEQIAEAARPSQMIVMGTHTGGDLLLDFSSTAAEVIRNSNVSVLVLPCHHGEE